MIWHWFHSDFFATFANIWQWFFSIVGLPSLAIAIHSRMTEDRCRHCWRKGSVPVADTHHKVCKTHAVEHGHTH